MGLRRGPDFTPQLLRGARKVRGGSEAEDKPGGGRGSLLLPRFCRQSSSVTMAQRAAFRLT